MRTIVTTVYHECVSLLKILIFKTSIAIKFEQLNVISPRIKTTKVWHLQRSEVICEEYPIRDDSGAISCKAVSLLAMWLSSTMTTKNCSPFSSQFKFCELLEIFSGLI